MTATILTVAPGPVPDLVRTAKACEAIGAAIVHVPAGTALGELREHTGLLIRADAPDGGPDLVTCPADDAELHRRLRELGIVPVYEVAEPEQLARLLAEHGAPYGGHVHCELAVGSAEALVAAIGGLPPGATFEARSEATLPVMLASLATGGHLRVGMADTAEYAPGEPVRDNAQLVARAAGLARIAQRPPAPPDDVRALLGVGDRRPPGPR